METQPQASNSSAVSTSELTPAEQNITQERKRRAITTALRLKNRERPLIDFSRDSMERQLRTTSLLSLARRAVRRVVSSDSLSFSQRLRRDNLLRKWTRYAKDMATLGRY